MPFPLTLQQLKLKKEETYFICVASIAVLVWFVLIVTIIGIFYGLLVALFIWLANGLLIAHLRSESVLVKPDQMPVLYRTYMEVVDKLEIKLPPPLYIVQGNGLLNAFATRRGGRHFVAVYSDMLEACGQDTGQIRFLLGHELGHVRSNHVLKKMILLPGLICPLLGTAYSRACEATCDRYGAFAAGDLSEAAKGLLVLAGGKNAWRDMDPTAFSDQYRSERGFFVSWHELISGYPTLSQRAYNVLSLDLAPQPARAERNVVAYLFAFFTNRAFAFVLIMAIYAAILVPVITRSVAANRQKLALQKSSGYPVAGAMTTQLMTVTFSANVDDNGVPSEPLAAVPAAANSIYATCLWHLNPGNHVVRIASKDAAGNIIHLVRYIFTADATTWHTWTRIPLRDFNPRPAQFDLAFYLDDQMMGTQSLPASPAQ